MVGRKENRARLLSGAQWKDKTQWAHVEIQEIPFKHKKKYIIYIFNCETQEQVAGAGRGVSALRDNSKLSWT